jgi:uncharacterized membrane protein YqjE
VTDGDPSQTPSPGPSAEPAPPPPPPPPPADAAGNGAKAPEEMSVGELVFEVSDRASGLIREEIELAKTEVTEKFNRLLQGSVAGLVAGVFALFALFLLMLGIAWLLNDLVFNNLWTGFFVEAVLFLLIGAAAGWFAYRSFQRAAPPTPDMAIEQAKEIKAAFADGEDGS